MEAGDTHVPPPVWGDDSYTAGRDLPPWPPYRLGGLLVLLKYPFYPLFILDNGMNSISKSLTVLTPA